MQRRFLEENRRKLYELVLQPIDVLMVATASRKSLTTVYNILKGRTKVNYKTNNIGFLLDTSARKRIEEINQLAEEVEEYSQLTFLSDD